MTERSSFKIFVGVFPPKNIASVGNSITIYQTSVMEYYPATILDNPQIINESYDQNDCENTILGCDENFIVPPPPDNCGGGTQGPPGPPGPQGPPGPAGTGGSGGRIYCGTLPGPTEPPADDALNFECLKSVSGYVVGALCNQTDEVSLQYMTVPDNVSYYNFSTKQWGNYGSGTTGIIECLDNPPQNGKLDVIQRAHGSLNGGPGGAPSFSYQWTFQQYLSYLYPNGEPSDRGAIEQTCRGGGQQGVYFVPQQFPFTSGGTSQYGKWLDLVGGGDGGGLKDEIIGGNPDCGPGQSTKPPPVTNAGGSICGGGAPPTNTSSTCGECPPNSGISNCADVKPGDVFIDATNGVMYFATSAGGFADNGIPLAGEGACDTTGCPECPETIDGGGGGGGGGGGTSCPDCPSVCPEGQECAEVGCPGTGGVSDQNGDPCPCSVDIGEGGAQPGVYTCCPENWNCQPPAQPCPSGNFPTDACCECAIEVNGQTSYVNKVCPCPEGQECRGPCPECPACNSCCGTQTYSSTGLTGGL